MAITIRKADVAVADGLVTQLIEMLPAPAKGELTVADVTLAFDPDDPADVPWIARASKIDAALASAQQDHAEAVAMDDAGAIAASDTLIRNLTVARMALYDNAFGYYARDKGKATVLKGSLLDRVINAVKNLNGRTAWLAGDSITVRAVDLEKHTLKVVRQPYAKRTRVLRPTLASIAEQIDAKINALTATEAEKEAD